MPVPPNDHGIPPITVGPNDTAGRPPMTESVVSEARSAASEHRAQWRESLKIPVQLHKPDTVIAGHSLDTNPGGLGIISGCMVSAGTRLDLQCAFGETSYLNISGEVIYCTPLKEDAFAVGIKFVELQKLQSKILCSAIEEVKQSVAMQEQSLQEYVSPKGRYRLRRVRCW